MKDLTVIILIWGLAGNCSSKQNENLTVKPNLKEITKIKIDPKLQSNWSEFQMSMNWDDARERCERLKMRLPTRDELTIVAKSKLWQEWKQERNFWIYYCHWTSEEYEHSVNGAYCVDMNSGGYGRTSKDNYKIFVRCIR